MQLSKDTKSSSKNEVQIPLWYNKRKIPHSSFSPFSEQEGTDSGGHILDKREPLNNEY